MIFTFYKARGMAVGSSLVEEDKLELAKELEIKAKVGRRLPGVLLLLLLPCCCCQTLPAGAADGVAPICCCSCVWNSHAQASLFSSPFAGQGR